MELNTLNDVSGREGAERNRACPCVNKGKHVCAVSGRSIASLHITWCKGIIYNTARHVPTALFKMHDLSRSRPAPIMPTLARRVCLIMLYDERHCEARRHLFSARRRTSRNGLAWQLFRIHGHYHSEYQSRCMITMYLNLLAPTVPRLEPFFMPNRLFLELLNEN